MTEDRKLELRQLLEEATPSLIIEEPEGYDSITVEKYKEIAKAFRESYRPELSYILLYYRPDIQDEVLRSKLYDFVKEELTDYIRYNESADPPWTYSICPAKIAIRGGGIFACPLDSILRKFLEISIASGTDKAISALDKCTRETSGTFQKVVLLQGPICDPFLESETEENKEIQVSDGIRLVQFPINPSELPPYLYDQKFSIVLSSAGSSVFREKTVLIIDYIISPLFCKPSSGNENQFEIKTKSLEFPNFDVEKFCRAFSLVSNYAVEPVLQWSYIDQDELFNPQSVTTEVLNLTTPKEKFGITIVDKTRIEKIKDRYKELINLSSDVEEKLQIPIDRWIKSKTSQTPEDKIIDVAIALEALYLSDISEPTELSFRLRLHAAWLLKKKIKDRKDLMKDISQIYEWRSSVVHKGKLPKKKISKKKKRPYTQEEIKALITNAQDICRDSIMKILEDGKFPEWNSLILGEESS